MEETTDVGASDSPEATPGSALHRFGKARRKLARELRGPRRLARLYSQGAQSETELNVKFMQEVSLSRIQFLKQIIRCMEYCPAVGFHDAPDMGLKLIDQASHIIM